MRAWSHRSLLAVRDAVVPLNVSGRTLLEGLMNSPQMLPDGQTLLFTLGANTEPGTSHRPESWSPGDSLLFRATNGPISSLARGVAGRSSRNQLVAETLMIPFAVVVRDNSATACRK